MRSPGEAWPHSSPASSGCTVVLALGGLCNSAPRCQAARGKGEDTPPSVDSVSPCLPVRDPPMLGSEGPLGDREPADLRETKLRPPADGQGGAGGFPGSTAPTLAPQPELTGSLLRGHLGPCSWQPPCGLGTVSHGNNEAPASWPLRSSVKAGSHPVFLGGRPHRTPVKTIRERSGTSS